MPLKKITTKPGATDALVGSDTPGFTTSSNDSTSEGWSGAHVQFYQAEEMKTWIILDNGSTENQYFVILIWLQI